MLDTLLRASDFADKILSLENYFDDESKKTFRLNCDNSWSSYRQSVIVPLHEAKSHLDEMPNNWLYDRKSGLVWVNLEGGMHATMMANLYILHKGGSNLRDWTCEQADGFVIECHGMFLSSVGDFSYKGSKLEMTRQEKTVFSKARLKNLDGHDDY